MNVSINRIIVEDKDNRANGSAEIIESVRTEGILVPLLVFERGEDYVLIAGHRRLLSAQKFGLTEVPVQVLTEEQTETARALENLDRKQLHPLDEAEQIKNLQSKGYSNETIGAILGISNARVIRRSKLNNLSEKRLNEFRKGTITADQAEELAVFPKEIQDKTLIQKWMSADDLRNALVASQGISLENCTNAFLEGNPGCSKCPENSVTENEGLFPGLNGSCKNPQCYAKKLVSLMEKMEAKAIVAPRKEIADLVPNAPGSQWMYTLSVYNTENPEKFMDENGNILYKQHFYNEDKDDPKAEALETIAEEYSEEWHNFEKRKPAFFKECAKAYMDKNYRNIPMTGGSDLVRMSEFFIERLGYTYSRSMGISEEELKGFDNVTKVGITLMQMYVNDFSDNDNGPSPQRLWSGIPKDKEIEVPQWLVIPEALSLRKIKAQKPLQDSLNKLKEILDRYKAEKESD